MSEQNVRDLGIAQLPAGGGVVAKSATGTLTLSERFVHATVNTASGDITLTLPDVAEAIGLIFHVFVTMANAKTLTLEDNGNDAGLTDLDMDADGDNITLYSTGRKWVALNTAIA